LVFGLAWNDDLLGYDRRGGQGHCQVLYPGAHALPAAPQGVAHLFEVHDVAVHHRVLGQRLDGIALEAIAALAGSAQLDHFHGR
jgi:hypothetical protein